MTITSTCPDCGASMLHDDAALVRDPVTRRWRHVRCPELPSLRSLRGIAPNLTGGVESVEFVRRQRDKAETEPVDARRPEGVNHERGR